MIRISELSLPLDHPEEALRQAILRRLQIEAADLLDYIVYKRSYDARKKNAAIVFVYIVDATVRDEAATLKYLGHDRHVMPAPDMHYYPVAHAHQALPERPAIVGDRVVVQVRRGHDVAVVAEVLELSLIHI